MESRSLESITLADLKRLGEVAAHDRKDFFERRPDRNFLEDRVFAVALCQGAAKHYIDGENGCQRQLKTDPFYLVNANLKLTP